MCHVWSTTHPHIPYHTVQYHTIVIPGQCLVPACKLKGGHSLKWDISSAAWQYFTVPTMHARYRLPVATWRSLLGFLDRYFLQLCMLSFHIDVQDCLLDGERYKKQTVSQVNFIFQPKEYFSNSSISITPQLQNTRLDLFRRKKIECIY